MNDWRDLDGDAAPGGADYPRALKQSTEGDGASTAASASALARDTAEGDAPKERRAAARYKCEGGAEFYVEGSEVRTWGMVSDISRSGCYVELHATSPIDTPLNMRLDIDGLRIRVKGTVRTSYPSLGMGISFTELDDANSVQLEELLLRLSGTVVPVGVRTVPAHNPGPPGLLMVTNPSAALNAIAKFFHSHRAMSREEFEELIVQSQSPGLGVPR